MTDLEALRERHGLTRLQARFCEEYIIDLDAKNAAIRAGYSEPSAHQLGWRNLQHPKVQGALQELIDDRSERTQLSADRVLLELARIGFADIRDLMTWSRDGVHFRPSNELSEDEAATIRSVKSKTRRFTREDGTVEERIEIEMKLHPKLPALEKLGKHLNLFGDIQVNVLHLLRQLPPQELDRLEALSDDELSREIQQLAPGREVGLLGTG